jgi:cytochrome c oxidase subunit IV
MAQETHPSAGGHAVEEHHPTPLAYFTVAMILSAITAIEVLVFYFTWLGKGIIPVLAVLSGAKFAMVAMFYMHLKYDARLFSALFVGGLALAATVMFALMGLFRFFL